MFYPFPLQLDRFPPTIAPQRRPSTRYDAISPINSYQLFPSSRNPRRTKSTSDREAANTIVMAKSEHVEPHTTYSSSAPNRASISRGIQLPRLFPSRHIAHQEQKIHVPPRYRHVDFLSWETYSETTKEFSLFA
jgi:hypothetical protein